MNIITGRSTVRNTSANIYRKIKENQNLMDCVPQAAAKSSGFDQITISRSADVKLSDDQFANMLSKQLSNEVKAGTSSYELNDLQRQVALEQYDINPTDIVRKMMFE